MEIVAGIASILLLTLLGVGVISSYAERRNAPGRLLAARASASRGDVPDAFRNLWFAFHHPLSDRFDRALVQHDLEVLRLLDELLRACGVDPEPLTGRLSAALRDLADGGAISSELTRPVKKFLEHVGLDGKDAAEELRAFLASRRNH